MDSEIPEYAMRLAVGRTTRLLHGLALLDWNLAQVMCLAYLLGISDATKVIDRPMGTTQDEKIAKQQPWNA